jgi:hypothetical protein
VSRRLSWAFGIERAMPTELECQGCHLIFAVGWYHYHSFDSGYAAMTRLVCARCGTMHALEHAVSLAFSRQPVEESSSLLARRDVKETSLSARDLPSQQKPDRLLAQAGPLFVNVEERKAIRKKYPLNGIRNARVLY